LASKSLSIIKPCIRNFSSKVSPPCKKSKICWNYSNPSFGIRKFTDPGYGNPPHHYTTVKDVKFPVEDFKDLKVDGNDPKVKTFSYFVMGSAMSMYAGVVKNFVMDAVEMLQPSDDVLALANVEVDLSPVQEGTTITVKWRGKPLFIRRRTPEEIETARATPLSVLKDPQADDNRVKKPEWLIVLGVCTHLGCVPLPNQGEYNGWFCPCHGSHYDISGRIRKGPAPANLEVPPYTFTEDQKILVGVEG
jgi:ubiquinol-cytochrome c reductase iron-sulfur subunit